MSDLVSIDNTEGMRALMARKLGQIQPPAVDGLAGDVAAFESSLVPVPAPMQEPVSVKGINLAELSPQFTPVSVHDSVHDDEKCVMYITQFPEHEQSGEQSPRQKIAAGKALQAQGYAELSSGVYLSTDQLSEVFTVFMNSLDTDHPMQPVDAVAAVHPEHGYMLTRRSNQTQLRILRAELSKHLSHPVVNAIVGCPHLGKEMLDGCAAPSIGATLNQLHRYYKIAKYMQETDQRIRQLEQALLTASVNTVNSATVNTAPARPAAKSLSPEMISGIQQMSGSVRNVAKHYGVSVGVVSKYRNAAAA